MLNKRFLTYINKEENPSEGFDTYEEAWNYCIDRLIEGTEEMHIFDTRHTTFYTIEPQDKKKR